MIEDQIKKKGMSDQFEDDSCSGNRGSRDKKRKAGYY
jgi:hypothetical protein